MDTVTPPTLDQLREKLLELGVKLTGEALDPKTDAEAAARFCRQALDIFCSVAHADAWSGPQPPQGQGT